MALTEDEKLNRILQAMEPEDKESAQAVIEALEKRQEPQYLTEAHRINSERAMKTIAESKKFPTSLEKAREQVLRNSKDYQQDTN